MWLYCTAGFFSVVQKPVTPGAPAGLLVVRARANGDLERLRAEYLPELGEIIATPHGDYKYRAACTHEALARAMAKIAQEIDYPNFKSEVSAAQGYSRAHVYLDVWRATLGLERMLPDG